ERAVGGATALRVVPAGRDQLPAGVALVQPQRRQVGDERLGRLERGDRLLVAPALVQLVRLLDLLAPPHLAAAKRAAGGDERDTARRCRAERGSAATIEKGRRIPRLRRGAPSEGRKSGAHRLPGRSS